MPLSDEERERMIKALRSAGFTVSETDIPVDDAGWASITKAFQAGHVARVRVGGPPDA